MLKISYHKIIIFIIIYILSFSLSYSQKTGFLNDTILFNGEDRIISFYIPTNYTSDSTYQLMVCLHGLGDNSNNFRGALISSLGWHNFMPNTIFACPDGGSDQNKDFYSPPGDELIIPTTIELSKSKFIIDTTKIILEGFSLGGRSALKYGLENPEMFRGLLLNTPAAQGIEDALNNPFASLIYKYENARKVKIAITHGTEDNGYLNPDEIIFEKLIENDGFVMKELVQNMGHNIPGKSIIQKCLNFFNHPATDNYDLELRNLIIPIRTCNANIKPKLKIRNLGDSTITSAKITYKFNDESETFDWEGNLSPYQQIDFELPEKTGIEGFNIIEAELINLDENFQDTIVFNNLVKDSIQIVSKGIPLNFTEGFEYAGEAPDNWILNSSGHMLSWMFDDVVKKDGDWSLFMIHSILIPFYTGGSVEEIMTPVLDLTSVPNPSVSFHYAYNYHRYTPPYFTQQIDFIDTLEISLSTDCGETFQQLFRSAGPELATSQEPIINVLEITKSQFIPTQWEWRKLFFDLSSYSNVDNAVIKLSIISGSGGSINIDNIFFGDGSTVGVIDLMKNSDNDIYPNPANDFIIINFEQKTDSDVKIKIYDNLGNNVLNLDNHFTSGKNQQKLNIKKLNQGSYLIHILGKDLNITRKFIKQ